MFAFFGICFYLAIFTLASLVLLYGFSLVCVLYANNVSIAPHWMYEFLNIMFPNEGWDEEEEDEEE